MKTTMKFKALLLVALVPVMTFSTSLARASNEGSTLKKAQYLAMDRYSKINFLLFQFGLADRGAAGLKYQNLETSQPFRLVGQTPEGVSYKSFAAAKKAVKQYELDSRENGQGLVATTLLERDQDAENIWAILLSHRQITRSGAVSLQPVVIYSVERNSQGEVLVRVISNFRGPVL